MGQIVKMGAKELVHDAEMVVRTDGNGRTTLKWMKSVEKEISEVQYLQVWMDSGSDNRTTMVLRWNSTVSLRKVKKRDLKFSMLEADAEDFQVLLERHGVTVK